MLLPDLYNRKVVLTGETRDLEEIRQSGRFLDAYFALLWDLSTGERSRDSHGVDTHVFG